MSPVAKPPEPDQWPDDLRAIAAQLPEPAGAGRCWVALSGGLDSVFLLHLLAACSARQSFPLQAIHVHHGLHDNADDWAEFCHSLCHSLSIPLTVEKLSLSTQSGDLESRARDARYRRFAHCLQPGDTLAMGHHGDDQAETLLLRLLRGSGVRGLAAMPEKRPLGAGTLIRPLLPLSRDRIRTLALDWGLTWQEDPSNQDRAFDRNYLRHEILPRLQERWPGTRAALNRSVRHVSEANHLLDELAEKDLAATGMTQGVTVTGLKTLTAPRQRNLIRYRLAGHGVQPPGEDPLHEGLHALLNAPADGSPELSWGEYRVRRFNDQLWLLTPTESTPWPTTLELDG